MVVSIIITVLSILLFLQFVKEHLPSSLSVTYDSNQWQRYSIGFGIRIIFKLIIDIIWNILIFTLDFFSLSQSEVGWALTNIVIVIKPMLMLSCCTVDRVVGTSNFQIA